MACIGHDDLCLLLLTFAYLISKTERLDMRHAQIEPTKANISQHFSQRHEWT